MSQDAVYFNVWFSACYMRLRERLSYYDLDEDAFHDTYLLVREKALCSVGGIADFEAYFRACYRHAVLHRHRTPRRDVHPGTGFFLRLCDEGPTVPEEELGACERLVLDILAFIRRSFPLHKGDRPCGASGQAITKPVTVIVAHELRFPTYHGDCAFMACLCA